MKKIVLALMLALYAALPFALPAESMTLGTYETFKKVKEMWDANEIKEYTPNQLYEICKQNEVWYEKNLKNNVFGLTGIVTAVRRSFLDEYIVELETSESLIDIGVVYPKNITEAKIQDLANLRKGQTLTVLVYGRSNYMYVDVLYWDQNGKARTEL